MALGPPTVTITEIPMGEDYTRRLRRFKIAQDMIADMLADDNSWKKFQGLPPKAEMVKFDFCILSQCFELVFEHPSFDEVNCEGPVVMDDIPEGLLNVSVRRWEEPKKEDGEKEKA